MTFNHHDPGWGHKRETIEYDSYSQAESDTVLPLYIIKTNLSFTLLYFYFVEIFLYYLFHD